MATEALVVKVLEKALEAGLLDKIVAAFRRKTHVLILGLSGSGKTQFLKSLSNEIQVAINYLNRTNGPATTKKTIAGNAFKFYDGPGTPVHGERRLDETREAFAGRYDGIIDVVSYGYCETDVPPSRAVTDQGAVRPEYLLDRRSEEIAAVSQWSRLLTGFHSVRWAITLVTKADLWWEEQEAVKAHYTVGPYAQAFGQSMRPTVCLYSSVSHRFYDRVRVSSGFDGASQSELKKSFLETLLALCGRSI